MHSRLFSALAIGCSLFTLAACTKQTPPPEDAGTQTSRQSEARTATYRGVIREAGVSIYMQGTHRLELEDGGFILLESQNADLNAYVGREVIARGLVEPTVEAGGLIMNVETVSSIAELSSSAASALSSEVSETSASSVSSLPSSARSSTAAETNEPPTSSDPQAVQQMLAADLGAENWTQRYCSTHIGFCVPVHRNWWFKSFGTTSSTLWHVEIGPEEIEELDQGPISVNVIAGSLASAGAQDGVVTLRGSMAVGYKAWSDDRHIEVIAPQALEAAVSYIIGNLTETESE